ncbi:SHOCT domain-containing protein [Leifsonia sp. NPDC058248]|uniref:SHOCT domain-containing protein n=1 Tax=Leifsonia sp. NPDC058248 TaxID=3346402 RepID=UPI0036DCF470
MTDKPLYEFTSHIDGKNAKVQIWPDRIEWERKGVSAGKVAAGVWTLGISTIFTGVRGHDTDMVPIAMITSVTSKKGMGTNTVVSVLTGAGAVDFRVSHKEAAIARDTLNRLILESKQPQIIQQSAPAAPAAATSDVGAQLQQLGALRDQGILTEEEFAAKKAELLSRI